MQVKNIFPVYRGMRLTSETSKQLARLAFLNDSGSQMESEHWRTVAFLLVQLDALPGLAASHGQRFWRKTLDILWSGLNIQEDNLKKNGVLKLNILINIYI